MIGYCSAISISESYETVQPPGGGHPRQFFTKEGSDEYTYGYTNSESYKTERRTADGVIEGVFGAVDPRG